MVTIDQEGPNVVATGSGNIDVTGLELGGQFGIIAGISPSAAVVSLFPPEIPVAEVFGGARTPGDPTNFGTGGLTRTNSSTGSPVALLGAEGTLFTLFLPLGYMSDDPLGISTATFDNASFTTLGITPGLYTWTWSGGGPGTDFPDRSFTINVVPGPIVGAGLPGLIAALGGLVAMVRRRRKQLA